MRDNKTKLILKASWISFGGNGILAVLKISVGLFAGSLAVVGDGIDSSIDVIISLITILTAGIISKPPDKEHAFGHEKADSIAAKTLSFFIFYAGMQLLISSIQRLMHPEETQIPQMTAVIVTLFSIAGKMFLALYQYKIGKKTDSTMLIANAKNMKYDVLISSTVLIGLLVSKYLNMPIADPIAALVLSIIVLKGAIEIFLDTNIELMDGVKNPKIYNHIFEAVEEVKGAYNAHRVRSKQIGNAYMIIMDIEVDGTTPLKEAHEIANKVETKIREKVDNIYDIIVHIEPLGDIEKNERLGFCKHDVE